MSVSAVSAASYTSPVYAASYSGKNKTESSASESGGQPDLTNVRGDASSANPGRSSVNTESDTAAQSGSTSSASTASLMSSLQYDKKDNNQDGLVTTAEEDKYYLKHPGAKPQSDSTIGKNLDVTA